MELTAQVGNSDRTVPMAKKDKTAKMEPKVRLVLLEHLVKTERMEKV